MRLLLILVSVLALVITGWFAVVVGSDRERALGAPQIEALVDAGARAAAEGHTHHPVQVATDGRNVTVTGLVDSDDERQALLRAVSDVELLVRVEDRLRVLPRAEPFDLAIEKSLAGEFVVRGFVPDEATLAALGDAVTSAADGAPVTTDLTIAAGTPHRSWGALALNGLTALGHLDAGRVRLSDDQAEISGTAGDVQELASARNVLTASPAGAWTQDLQGRLPLRSPYTFYAVRTPDGAVLIDGHAPDEATRDALVEAAEAASSQPVGGQLELADGMPGPEWPTTVAAGLAALAKTEQGQLSVSGAAVTLDADVADDDALAMLIPELGDGWEYEIAVSNPTPPAELTIEMAGDGALSANGSLPGDMALEQLQNALPIPDLSGVAAGERRKIMDWSGALDGVNIVLPRFETASFAMRGRTMIVDGTLRRGVSADGVLASLSSAAGPLWTVRVDARESLPEAVAIVSTSDGGTTLKGLLPEGMDPEAAVALLGGDVETAGLARGGDGSVAHWTKVFEAIRETLAFYETASVQAGSQTFAVDGVLLPGQAAEEIQVFTASVLPEGWTAALQGRPTEPSEGDRRRVPGTPDVEDYRRGFWLPIVDFPVDRERCDAQSKAAIEDEQITFVTGSAEIDARGRRLLNHLAAISMRCLNSSTLRLQVAGHTDSVGNDESNLALSDARARAVVDALIARGVREDALTARGYGETLPVASNDTADGRAANRRISFDWTDGED